MRSRTLSILVIAALSALPASAGSLDDFEDEVRRAGDESKEPAPERARPRDDGVTGGDPDGCDSDSFGAFLFCTLVLRPVGYLLAEGAHASFVATQRYRTKRRPGHPTLPFVRIDHTYQRLIGDDVNGYDLAAEVGWSSVGLSAEWFRYWEEPADLLDSVSIDALYRTSPGPGFRLDLAVGYRLLEGDHTSEGVELGFPVGVYLVPGFGFELDPTFAFLEGRAVHDHRAALIVYGSGLVDRDHRKGVRIPLSHTGLRAGWRVLHAGDETLHGPELTWTWIW